MKKKLFYIMIIFTLVFLFGCNNPTPETYLIPSKFEGKVDIIFNQTNGSKPVHENGRRVYNIPTDGILLTQFKNEEGFINHAYYYVDSLGNRTPLEIFRYDHNKDGTVRWIIKDSSVVGVFNDGTVGSLGNSKYVFQEFVVCNFNEYNNINNKLNYDKVDKHLRQLLPDAFKVDTLIIK